MRFPGIGFTSASCSAYSIQNGVRFPGPVSPGSSQAGAIVTYTANRISPSGLVCAEPPATPPNRAARASIAAAASFPRRFIVSISPVGRSPHPCRTALCRAKTTKAAAR